MSDETIRLIRDRFKIILWIGDHCEHRPICYRGVALVPCSFSLACQLMGMLEITDFILADRAMEKNAYQLADYYAYGEGAVTAQA
jgi:hypothetical protein